MSNFPSPIDDALLDRLVDGELAADERRQVLSSLDQTDGWRRCALAFLEAQSWRSELSRIAKETVIAPPRSGEAASAAGVPAAGPPTRAEAIPSSTIASVASRPRESRAPHHRWGAWLASAAALLLAFGLGWGLGSPDHLAPGVKDLAVVPGDRAPAGAGSSRDAVTLLVRDEHGAPQRIQVPLVDGDQLGAQFAGRPQWASSPELLRRLGQQGLDLQARRRYAPMYFEQKGGVVPMVVPVDDAYVTPVSRPVY